MSSTQPTRRQQQLEVSFLDKASQNGGHAHTSAITADSKRTTATRSAGQSMKFTGGRPPGPLCAPVHLPCSQPQYMLATMSMVAHGDLISLSMHHCLIAAGSGGKSRFTQAMWLPQQSPMSFA